MIFVQVVRRDEDGHGGGGWAADVAVSYREPKPFRSPFVVQPRQGVVEPRSDGVFKVNDQEVSLLPLLLALLLLLLTVLLLLLLKVLLLFLIC